jgi:hypothetical protein
MGLVKVVDERIKPYLKRPEVWVAGYHGRLQTINESLILFCGIGDGAQGLCMLSSTMEDICNLNFFLRERVSLCSPVWPLTPMWKQFSHLGI